MSFNSLFSQAWREYRTNAGVSARIMTIFYMIPLILAAGIFIFALFWSGILPAVQEFTTLEEAGKDTGDSKAAERILISFAILLLLGLVLFTALFFINFFAYAALIGGAARGPVMSYRDALAAGKAIYWPLMGYFALLMLIVLVMELVFIIGLVMSAFVGAALGGSVGGVLFAVAACFIIGVACFALLGRLAFGPYVLAREGSGVISAFKRSWEITRTKTLAMIGYMALIFFIFFVFMIAALLLAYGLRLSLGFENGGLEKQLSEEAILAEASLHLLLQLVFALFLTPFFVHFFKQVYTAWGTPMKGKRMFK